MDELKQAWSELHEKKIVPDNGLSQQEIRDTVKARSSGLIEHLYRKVRFKFYFAVAFTICWGVIIPIAPPFATQALLSILFLAFFVGSVLLYQEIQILKKGIDMSQDLLHGLISYRKRIVSVLRSEERGVLSLYPISAAAGYFLGTKLVDKNADIMSTTTEWIVLTVILTALTVGGHYLTRRLNRASFGKYLDKLEENIRELQG